MADRTVVGIRVALGLLAAIALEIGVWASLAPRSFFDGFPGFGRAWVAADGPFNEHLVRDVGQLYLALGIITAAALVRPSVWIIRAVAAAWLVEGVLHFVYHADHADLYGTADRVLNIVGLGLAVVLAALALVLSGRLRTRRLRPPPLVSSSDPPIASSSGPRQ
ncbi:MAG: hypothetical protein ACRD29_08900 [Acidimicrobiales bacterium]